MKRFILLLGLLIILGSFKNDKPSYRLYNHKGKAVKYKKIIKEALKADVIFFGELHNNPIDHWLQLEITQDLFALTEGDIILGAEMFERDNAEGLSRYLKGEINEDVFKKEVRLWNNYKTDYRPLVEFSKENELDFIATNIPRRYAAMVHKKGFEVLDRLPVNEKAFMAPLPVLYNQELACYANMMKMMGAMGHASENLPKAQAIKDATMAHSIVEHFSEGYKFIHYNGTYHSNNNEGIVWYLKKYRPELKVMTIASVEQKDILKLEEDHEALADFILVIPENMTKTY